MTTNMFFVVCLLLFFLLFSFFFFLAIRKISVLFQLEAEALLMSYTFFVET